MKRHLLTSNGVLHVIDLDDDGRRLSDERCQVDDMHGSRVLRLGEEPVGEVHHCENCFGKEEEGR